MPTSNTNYTKKEYQISDRVITTGPAQYEIGTIQKVPFGTEGVVVGIRHRYTNTPNEYKQFKVSFKDYPEGDSVTNLYLPHNLKKYGE